MGNMNSPISLPRMGDRVSGARVLSQAAQMCLSSPYTPFCLSYHVCPIRSPSTVIPSAAEGSLLHCQHMYKCVLAQTIPWCFLFRLSLPHGLPVCKKDPSTSVGMTNRIRITSHSFSYRCIELCLFEALYPAPSARTVWPHRKAP